MICTTLCQWAMGVLVYLFMNDFLPGCLFAVVGVNV